jgi:hypothetical protein
MATTAKKEPILDNTISASIKKAEEEAKITKVGVFIPVREEDNNGVAVDQNDYVTVNGKTTKVPRGEHVEVSVPVFLQLRNRYPNL